MSALIRTQHDDCPVTTISPKNIKLTLTPNQLYGTYTFKCPHCEYYITKTASQKVIDRLIDLANVPFHVNEPTPFTTQDLIKFHKLLETPLVTRRDP